jgi:predicted dinucleotide-binding enzyme
MKIAIIGHGNVGGALASRWAAAGHQLLIGAREPQDEKALALADVDNISMHTIPEAVAEAQVILVATPAHIVASLAESWGDCSGKTVIDATNAVGKKPDPFPTAFHALQQLTSARVVKCFNTTGFENMQNPQYGDTALDMYMAGDDDTAKAVARQLAIDAGFAECYDFGKADKVVLQEQFALSWINLAIMQGMGRDIAFKLIRRK